jgi:4-amino-4-deoxy-L-arabinose transferase-like glycosyltransferase
MGLLQANRLLVLVLLVALVRLAMLGTYPLMDTTEARYGEIGRVMAASGDWITPWFRPDIPFWGKPPLSFWCTALSFNLFGVNEFAARLPHWIMGVLGGWLVWDLGARRSIREAVIAVSLLTGCLIYYVSAGAVSTDMALSLGLTLSMGSFWLAVQPNQSPALKTRSRWLFFLSLGWGLLAKGPIALVLGGLAIGAWLLASRSYWPEVRQLPWIRGSIFSMAIAAPWYWAAEVKTPGFLNYFLIGEHFKRFVVSGWEGDRYGSAHDFARGTIWLMLLVMLIPWIILIPTFLKLGTKEQHNREEQQIASSPNVNSSGLAWRNYLLSWGLAPCVFFTFSGNILWPYVLPGIPALSLLGGYFLARRDPKLIDRLLTTGLGTVLAISLIFIVALPYTGHSERKTERSLIHYYQSHLSNSSTNGTKLAYLGQPPYSASFYSNGSITFAENQSSLLELLKLKDYITVAIANNSKPDINSLIKGQLTKIKSFGRYTLYTKNKTKMEP